MSHIYACLLGNWIDLTDEDQIQDTNPHLWLKEHDLIDDGEPVNIKHAGKEYRIHMADLQEVSD